MTDGTHDRKKCNCGEDKKIATILCLDIDTLNSAVENNPDMALGFLKMLKERKDDILNDKKKRDSRYNALKILFSINKDIGKQPASKTD